MRFVSPILKIIGMDNNICRCRNFILLILYDKICKYLNQCWGRWEDCVSVNVKKQIQEEDHGTIYSFIPEMKFFKSSVGCWKLGSKCLFKGKAYFQADQFGMIMVLCCCWEMLQGGAHILLSAESTHAVLTFSNVNHPHDFQIFSRDYLLHIKICLCIPVSLNQM